MEEIEKRERERERHGPQVFGSQQPLYNCRAGLHVMLGADARCEDDMPATGAVRRLRIMF